MRIHCAQELFELLEVYRAQWRTSGRKKIAKHSGMKNIDFLPRHFLLFPRMHYVTSFKSVNSRAPRKKVASFTLRHECAFGIQEIEKKSVQPYGVTQIRECSLSPLRVAQTFSRATRNRHSLVRATFTSSARKQFLRGYYLCMDYTGYARVSNVARG